MARGMIRQVWQCLTQQGWPHPMHKRRTEEVEIIKLVATLKPQSHTHTFSLDFFSLKFLDAGG